MTLFWFLLFGALYFLPTITAWRRDLKAGAGVFVVNLFLGWTLFGWVVALAWAACGEPDRKPGAIAGRIVDS